MPWILGDSEYKAVLVQPAPKRYKYFLNHVADEEKVWILGDEGGLVAANDDSGQEYLPLWPHSRYAQACAIGEWTNSTPEFMDIAELQTLIPELTDSHRLFAIFPTPDDKGIPISPQRLLADLQEALSQYE